MLTYASTAAKKWSSLNVALHTGSIADIAPHIPAFERRASANRRLDWIVRSATSDKTSTPAPVATVSKRYALVQHTDVIDSIKTALEDAEISPADVHADLCLTEYGERMALSLRLPERFSFDPGDGHALALRFECLNSVDGSTRLRALLGWYRHICTNGLIVGTTQHDVRVRHAGPAALDGVGAALRAGLVTAGNEQKDLCAWRKTRVDPMRVADWIDNAVRERWGFKAAARAWHIVRTGADATVDAPYKGRQPTTIRTRSLDAVPGAPPESHNLFDVSQALAWLARQRRDLSEQVRWREEIPGLLRALAG
jgi:hypothetical protein